MQAATDDSFRFIIQRTAAVQSRLGSELGSRPLVLANGKFFPDKFTQDLASVKALLRRMQAHAGMLDVPLEVALVGGPSVDTCGTATAKPKGSAKKHACKGECKNGGKDTGACHAAAGSCGETGCGETGCGEHEDAEDAGADESDEGDSRAVEKASCGTGGCGVGCGTPPIPATNEPRLVDLGNSWRVQVPVAEVSHPLALTANLARTLGVVFVAETMSHPPDLGEPLEVTAEVTASLLGFSSLLLAGSYRYSKSCGGPRIGKVTTLGPGELALVALLFARRSGHDVKPLIRDLETTQRDAMRNAEAWLDERPAIVERFTQCPERLATGDIPMVPAKTGLLSRLFGKKASPRATSLDPSSSLEDLEAALSQELRQTAKRPAQPVDPRAAELRALVDEAFEGASASSE